MKNIVLPYLGISYICNQTQEDTYQDLKKSFKYLKLFKKYKQMVFLITL